MKGGEAARSRLGYHYFFPKGFVLYGTSLLPRKARAGSCGVNVFGEAGGERSTNNSSMAMHAKGCMGIMRIQWNREVGEYISSMNTQSGEGAVNPRPSTQTGMERDR